MNDDKDGFDRLSLEKKPLSFPIILIMFFLFFHVRACLSLIIFQRERLHRKQEN